ncbi:unnamed protein product [Durusdinium trenchii]|uniref:Sulfotransferase domain-containing protein n=1 Tax=Durusdinium trenchii TaxID=1381693 RepID=A0ABP0QJN8_9DINO
MAMSCGWERTLRLSSKHLRHPRRSRQRLRPSPPVVAAWQGPMHGNARPLADASAPSAAPPRPAAAGRTCHPWRNWSRASTWRVPASATARGPGPGRSRRRHCRSCCAGAREAGTSTTPWSTPYASTSRVPRRRWLNGSCTSERRSVWNLCAWRLASTWQPCWQRRRSWRKLYSSCDRPWRLLRKKSIAWHSLAGAWKDSTAMRKPSRWPHSSAASTRPPRSWRCGKSSDLSPTTPSPTRPSKAISKVFVVTFPRCGTTWMVQIAVCCLFGAAANYEDHALFLEGSIASSAAYVQHMEAWSDKPRPRLFKSHVPAEMHPGLAHGEEEILQEHGKVIYVVRNPKDALISLRHHHANNPAIGWTGSWDEWVRQWIAGDRSQEYGGSYFEHVKGWWTLAQRHPQRIRIFYFEEMKANLRQSVAEVAEFLQTSLGSTQVDEVCKACRFESMRGRHQVSEDIRSRVNPEHFRAGRVGSWREELTAAQAALVDERLRTALGREMRQGLRIAE